MMAGIGIFGSPAGHRCDVGYRCVTAKHVSGVLDQWIGCFPDPAYITAVTQYARDPRDGWSQAAYNQQLRIDEEIKHFKELQVRDRDSCLQQRTPWKYILCHYHDAFDKFIVEFSEKCATIRSAYSGIDGRSRVLIHVQVEFSEDMMHMQLGAPEAGKAPFVYSKADVAEALLLQEKYVELWEKQPGSADRVLVDSVSLCSSDNFKLLVRVSRRLCDARFALVYTGKA